MTPFWVSGFVDLEPAAYDVGLAFWRDVTGWEASPPIGDSGEFVALEPPVGDRHLLVQRLDTGPSRIHVDLHVDDPRAAADRAVSLGAREAADLGYVVMTSPGGFPFCLVGRRSSERAPATGWPDGHTSLVDQVCIDIPSELYEREEAFWRELTGSSGVDPSHRHAEFRWLTPIEGHGARLLLQRLDEPRGDVRGHLDLSTTDRAAEAARHEALGATRVADFDIWTLLTDPAGLAYCVTDRVPS
jgi:hypothetical protein